MKERVGEKNKKLKFTFLMLSGFLILATIAGGFLVYFRWVKAASFNLYPGSCLGSWQNPYLAQGQPNAGDIASINKDNSSVFSEGGIKEIYCGSFNGELSENEIKLIKSVNLKFSWLVSDEEFPPKADQPLAEKTATSSIIIIQPLATSSEEVAQNTNDVVNQILNNIHADEVSVIVSTTTPEIIITTDSTSAPKAGSSTSSEQATSLPTSFWWKKYNFFFADDEVPNTAITTSDVVATTLDVVTTLESPLAPTEDFLKVSYTLDGVDWQALGTVNKNNWRDLSFNIPVYHLETEFPSGNSVSTLEDIKKIQIKIESLPILNKTPFVYLDGLALEVEYETSLTSQPKTAAILSQQSNSVSYSSYSRSPNGSNTASPVSISVSVDSFDDFGFGNGCGLNSQSCDFWGVRVTNFDNKSFNSKCVSKETLSHTFAFDLPEGSYIEVMAYAGHTQESCERGGEMSKFLEEDSLKEIFTVTRQ